MDVDAAEFVVLTGAQAGGRLVVPAGGAAVVGRGLDAELRLGSPGVSRRHLRVSVGGGDTVVRDLGSSNGTFVGDVRLTEDRVLRPGDTLLVGDVGLRFLGLRSQGTGAPDVERTPTGPPPAGTPEAYLRTAPIARGGARAVRPEATEDPRPAPGGHEGDDTVPWYRRVRPAVVGVGAAATALAAVVGLWRSVAPPDREDFAEITQVRVLQQATLSEYGRQLPDNDVTLSAAPDGRGSGAAPAAWSTRVDPVAAESTDSATATVAPTPTLSPTPTVSPTVVPGPTGTVSPTPAPTAPAAAALRGWDPPDAELLERVEGDPVLDDENLDPVTTAMLAANGFAVGRDDPEAATLRPEEVAVRLADSLRQVEDRPRDGQHDRLGWIVAVDLETSGYAGVPLLLTWSLGGPTVSANWAADTVAFRLTADKDHDTGSVELWVPDLAEPGAYRVNVELVRVSDGEVVTHGPAAEITDP